MPLTWLFWCPDIIHIIELKYLNRSHYHINLLVIFGYSFSFLRCILYPNCISLSKFSVIKIESQFQFYYKWSGQSTCTSMMFCRRSARHIFTTIYSTNVDEVTIGLSVVNIPVLSCAKNVQTRPLPDIAQIFFCILILVYYVG